MKQRSLKLNRHKTIRKMKLQKGTEITPASIASVIRLHAEEKSRILRLKDVFDGWSSIKEREYNDVRKPTNRIDVPYPAYIVNTAIGHILSKPVTFKSEDKVFLDKVNEVLRATDESEVNLACAELAGIAGYAYQLSFTDGNGDYKIREVCPSELIVVHDNTLLEDVQFAVRCIDSISLDGEVVVDIAVYTTDEIIHYRKEGDDIKFVRSEEHYFGEVPVSVFEVNNQRFGLFEKVLDLIDEYAQLASDTANDFESFCNAILVVSGYLIDDEEKADFLETLMLQFNDGEGDAKYLIKDLPSEAIEAYKTRLDNDIHKYSFVPNMSNQEMFSGNVSGISLEFKLMGLDHLIGIIERKFTKGLSDRMRQYCRFASIEDNAKFEHTDIEAVFTKNRPVNAVEVTDMIVKLSEKGLMSNSSLMAMHPGVTDVEREREALKEGTLAGDLNYVVAGILSKKAFLVKWFDMSEQEASAVLEDIQQERELTENSYANPYVDEDVDNVDNTPDDEDLDGK